MVTPKKAPGDAARVAAMAKLIPVMREECEKLFALVTEFEAIAGGGPTIGDKLRDVEAHFGELWKWRYLEDFVFNDFAVSRGQIKTLIKKLGSTDVLKTRITNYLLNGDPFYVDRRHPWAMFVKTINQHVSPGAGGAGLSATPDGCKHVPPCRDQFEHTKKRQAEQTT